MEAELFFADKEVFDDGAIQQITIWRLPLPVAGSFHQFKYRLFYGYSGRRLVGYDNERGKGDHRHIDGREEPYVFQDWATLINDFLEDVASARTKS